MKPDFKSGFELQCQYNDKIYDFFADYTDDGILHLAAKGSLPPALENTDFVLDGKTVIITSVNIEAELSFGKLPGDFIPKLIYYFLSSLSSDDVLPDYKAEDGCYYFRKTLGSKSLCLSFPCSMTDKSVYLIEIN